MNDPETTPEFALLAAALAFCAEQGMPATTFGKKSINDGSLIHDLKNGRELRSGTRRKVYAFMENHFAPAPTDSPPAAE